MSNTNAGIIERKATIFNVQKYNMYDGPGVRTLVFFQGCPLRCKWCSNPEGLERKFQVMFKSNLCSDCGACVSACPIGIHTINKKNMKHEIVRNIDCLGCRKCMDVCTVSAISIAGEVKTISELLKIIEEDKTFYDVSGGGVTLGGGARHCYSLRRRQICLWYAGRKESILHLKPVGMQGWSRFLKLQSLRICFFMI